MFLLTVSENVLLFISGFGILQGLLLASLLYFHPKSDKSVTTFLALFICCISIPILMPVGQQLFTWQVIIFVEPFTMLIGPLLYLYVRSFRESITWRKAWPHFVPFIIFIGISFVVYDQIGLKYPPSNKVPPEVPNHPLTMIPVCIRLAQRLLYWYLSLRALRSYQRSIRHVFSETSRINLRWVTWLINGYLVIFLCTVGLYIMILRYPEQFSMWVLSIGTLVSIYIYIAASKGITQSTLWQAQPDKSKEKIEAYMEEAEELDKQVRQEKVKVEKPNAVDDRLRDIASRILILLNEEKIYQETELTLQDLADKLSCPSYQVSQAINEGMKKSFYDLINGYRVEEAKRLLLDPGNRNYTILSVGFEAGFNSKTTFNTVFKKFTGLTPTDFREKQKAAVPA